MAKRKISEDRGGNRTTRTPYHSISLKKALKALQEKPQEEFDRLREAIETYGIPLPIDSEY
ncbi:MAG: hypothetical protein AAB394_00635 [Patescibacteria group bacterium]